MMKIISPPVTEIEDDENVEGPSDYDPPEYLLDDKYVTIQMYKVKLDM